MSDTPAADAVNIENVDDGPSDKERAQAAKARGNAAHQKGTNEGYQEAVVAYQEAIRLDPSDHVFHSNLCASYLELSKAKWKAPEVVDAAARAVEAAKQCTCLNPTWLKGWLRLSTAEEALLQAREKWEKEKKRKGEREKSKWDEEEEARNGPPFEVTEPTILATISAASLAACETTCRAGLKLDPTNAQLKLRLQALRDDGHKTNTDEDKALVSEELAAPLKAEGNAAFSAKKFKDAAEKYTAALSHNPFEKIFYSNRSACYVELDECHKALSDADMCLALDPSFAKGYSRKSAALFQLGRYPEAQAAAQAGLEVDAASAALQQLLAAAKVETAETPQVQQRLHELRAQKRKDEKLKQMLSGLNLGNNVKMFNGMNMAGPGGLRP